LIFRYSHPQGCPKISPVTPTSSSEFRLVAACCRWPPSYERDALVCERAASVDWNRVGLLVARNRVEGLMAAALLPAGVALPLPFAAGLKGDAVAIAQQNLAFAAESLRISRWLERASIPFMFVKGSTLDQLAYGRLALKRARDIDVAIEPERLADACALLAEEGYQRVVPGPKVGPEAFPAWVRHCKETAWVHRERGILVELHNGLVDNPDLLRGVSVASERQLVEIAPGIRLPTLNDADLYAYLCVHGATHAWSRLKWLADLAAFLARFSPDQIAVLHQGASQKGARRASGQALLLTADLLGTRLPDALATELRRDRSIRLLVRAARHVLASEEELDHTVLGTLPIHLSHFLLAPGFGAKVREARRKLRNPHDRSALALPRPLHFLYVLLAVPSWLWRRVRGPAPL
jgi:hypothetical protein